MSGNGILRIACNRQNKKRPTSYFTTAPRKAVNLARKPVAVCDPCRTFGEILLYVSTLSNSILIDRVLCIPIRPEAESRTQRAQRPAHSFLYVAGLFGCHILTRDKVKV